MWYIALCVLCSVIVSVLLKIARRQSIVLEQAIAFNYIMAITLSFIILKPKFPDDISGLPWGVFVTLGILLPSIFVIMGRAVQYAGIVRSDAAQRLSLFIPIVAAVTMFGEKLTQHRAIGLILAFIALFFLLAKPRDKALKGGLTGALLLLGVWLGYGVIDILFKQLAKSGAMFSVNLVIAFILACVLMFAYIFFRGQTLHLRSAVGGLILGVFNFYNILFYIKSHQAFSANPTLVFAAVNVGVIALGTLTGTILFSEKLRPINVLGILFAIASIMMLFYGGQLLAK